MTTRPSSSTLRTIPVDFTWRLPSHSTKFDMQRRVDYTKISRARQQMIHVLLSANLEDSEEERGKAGGHQGPGGDPAEKGDAQDRPDDQPHHHLGFGGEQSQAKDSEARGQGADAHGEQACRGKERLG